MSRILQIVCLSLLCCSVAWAPAAAGIASALAPAIRNVAKLNLFTVRPLLGTMPHSGRIHLFPPRQDGFGWGANAMGANSEPGITTATAPRSYRKGLKGDKNSAARDPRNRFVGQQPQSFARVLGV